MPPRKTIPVLLDASDEPPARQPRKAAVLGPNRAQAFAPVRPPARRVVNVDLEQLREGITGITEQLGTLLRDLRAVGDFRLASVDVALEVTAEGGVNLVGSLKAGAKGAIQLRFEPPPPVSSSSSASDAAKA